MASIADMLGVQWDAGPTPVQRAHSLSHHAIRTAKQKGFALSDVHLAANEPHHTYASNNHPGQMRHVRNGIVAVIDPQKRQVITVYEDQRETKLRPDQRNRPEAQAYKARQESR